MIGLLTNRGNMKLAVLAVALTMVFFTSLATADDALSPMIETEDRSESSAIFYRTPLQSEVIDQLTYEWRIILVKPRDGTTPPAPTLELSITSHNVNVAFVTERILVDGEDELYLSYGQSEAGCTKPKVCEYIETRSVQIPFAVLHNATGHSLKLVFIGHKKVKIVEIPAPIIQEFLKQSGA